MYEEKLLSLQCTSVLAPSSSDPRCLWGFDQPLQRQISEDYGGSEQ